MFNERWDRHFLKLALVHAEMSKDPRTRVGAVIVGPEKNIVSAGFNGFPRGIGDFPERLLSRELKLRLIVHAELNAILLAPHRPANCTLYLAITDDSGKVWGGPPCTRCTTHIIQSGITDIVSHQTKNHEASNWHEDIRFAGALLMEAGIAYREWPAAN